MGQLTNENVIKVNIQLPERVFNIDDIPWVPFEDGEVSCQFKPLRFDLSTGTWDVSIIDQSLAYWWIRYCL